MSSSSEPSSGHLVSESPSFVLEVAVPSRYLRSTVRHSPRPRQFPLRFDSSWGEGYVIKLARYVRRCVVCLSDALSRIETSIETIYILLSNFLFNFRTDYHLSIHFTWMCRLLFWFVWNNTTSVGTCPSHYKFCIYLACIPTSVIVFFFLRVMLSEGNILMANRHV